MSFCAHLWLRSRMGLLALVLLGLLPSATPAMAAGRDWLDAPQARPELDTLLAPPGRPLGGRDVEQDPALSPNGRWLAYAALADGNWDIWLRDLQAGPGEAPRRLTTHVAADLRPSFSADSRSLLFVTQREDVAGDVWELPLQRRPGRLKLGEARALLRRPGAQDHPFRDATGALVWEEESAAGPRVMRRAARGGILEIACPASLPRVGHGGLYFIRPREDGEELAFVADSLMGNPTPVAEQIWKAPAGLLDFQPGPEERLWVCTLEDGPALPGRELALPSQVWQLPRDGRRPPRPLLERGKAPRQISIARGRLVLTADGRPSTLWLEDAEGRFPVGGTPGKSSDPPVGAGTWLELARRYEGDELGLPLLQSIQAAWPGSKASDDAALREIRLRMLAQEDSTVLLDRISQLRGWLGAPDAMQRLAALELELRLRDGLESLAPLNQLAATARQETLPGAVAEAALAMARLELGRQHPQRAISALMEFETLPDTLPEQADALMLRVRAWEEMGEFPAARGALAQLATRHPHRPELLAEWLRRDLAALDGLPSSRARLRLRERLEDLKGIPALHMALMVELARREADAGRDGRTVAREDLRLVLEQDPAALPPFQRRVWTRGQALLADLRRLDGDLDKGLDGLAKADALLERAGEPGLQGLLRVRRLDWLLERARRAEQDGDWEAVEADARLMLRLDPVETRAWRLGLEALARLDRLEDSERDLRKARKGWTRKGGALRGVALQQRAVETWALGLLLSWQSEQRPARLAESDRLLEEALSLDDRLAVAGLTYSWNISRELAALDARRGGLGGLLQEVGRLPETVARLRHQGLASLKEPDEEVMRDRAILLAERGKGHALAQGDSLLAAALATNLGNLHFSRGEFGAQAARRAWEERLAFNPHFSSNHERLRFLMQLGTVRQWSGDLEGAARDLDSAQVVAMRLGAQEEGRQVVARLALLASERGRPVEAMDWLRQALALEADAGQRALLWRNLAMVQVEMGDAEASSSLAEAEREAKIGTWPMEPAQNWLRLRLLGVGLPLWNFPGLYTGQGRLDWGPEEEQALRQSLKDELSGREGALDRRLDGLHARRRLLRRQGDREGMLRLDLVIARELALMGRWEQALQRCHQAAADARDAFLPGPEARAVESAMAVVLLATRDAHPLPSETVKQARSALDGLLGAAAGLLPVEQRMRLELLRAQDLDDQATGSDPVHALMLRGQAMLALEELETWIKGSAVILHWRQRLSLDLAWARLLSATGDLDAAREQVAAWQSASLPPSSALLLDWARFQVDWARGDAAAQGAGKAALERDLDALRAEPGHLPHALLMAPVAEGLEAATFDTSRALKATGDAERVADGMALRQARFLWEQADPPFASQGAANAQARLRADARQAARVRESLLAGTGDGSQVARADSFVTEDWRLLERQDDRLVLWKPQQDFPAQWSQWKAEGLALAGEDSASTWLSAAPRLHAACREGWMKAPDEVALLGAASARGDSLMRVVSAQSLLSDDLLPLEARVLAVDGVLHLVPGAEQASWFQCGEHRVPLRRLMGLDLPGELLLVGEVDWQGRTPQQWGEAWLVLESLLAQSGLRRALLPGPGLSLHGAPLGAFAVEQGLRGGDSTAFQVPEGWFALGAPPLWANEVEQHRRSALEDMARRGAEHRKAQRPEAAWRQWRRALRLAVHLRDQEASTALLKQASALALDVKQPGEALDVLLDLLPRMDSTRVDWDKVAGRLVQAADLAERPALADSLWSRWLLAPRAQMDSTRRAQELRMAFEARLAALSAHGMAHRAAALAKAQELLPEGGDPRRALFLARLYLETESAARARACLDGPEIRWQELDSIERLDELELRSLVLQHLGELGGARRNMDQAARLVETSPPDSLRLAVHARHQADLAWQLGDYARCALELDRAQSLISSATGELAVRLELQVANTRGLLATELEERESAAAHFARAFAHGQTLGDAHELSAVCNNQSRLAQQGGDWVQALDQARQAAAWDSLSPGRGRPWTTLRNHVASLRGLLAEDLRLPEAWTSLPEALLRQRHARSQLEALRIPLADGRSHALEAGELREASRLGLELARVHGDLDEWEAALAMAADVAEKAWGQGFSREALEGELEAARALKALKRPAEARLVLDRALARADEESARLAPMRFDPGRGRMQRLLTDELVELLAGTDPWQALVASERGRNLGLREMVARSTLGQGMPRLESIDQVRKLLQQGLEPHQEWLGWHLGQRKAWAFWWHEGELSVWPLTVPRDSLRQVAALHRSRVLGFLSAEETGLRLARWLLPADWLNRPPARAWLLPQAELQDLALESLRLPDGHWLGERSALCRSGSLAEMAYTAALPGGEGAGAIWSDPQGTGMDALDFTSLESDELLRLHPGSRLLQGSAATEASVAADGDARRFRHFACHAVHDARSPAQSALLLGAGAGRDGRLAAPEIAALELPTGLTMLSACETALGRTGEEAGAGLPRAFMAAGSRGVVASLWKVDDLATAVLVKHLHRALAAGDPADVALQKAQQAVRVWVNGHPAYWAAFCLSGQPRPESVRTASR